VYVLLLDELQADLQAERMAGLLAGGGAPVPSVGRAREVLDAALAAPMRKEGKPGLAHDFRIAYGFEVS
jgi:hypothetical protein